MLTAWQVAKMSTRPDMILQFAHHLADLHGGAARGIQVRVRSLVSLNGGGVRPMIDPSANLAAEPPIDLARMVDSAGRRRPRDRHSVGRTVTKRTEPRGPDSVRLSQRRNHSPDSCCLTW